MNHFITALEAVFPLAFYIGLGFLARTSGAADEAFLKKMNGMIFKMFFPFVMFNNLYRIDFQNGPKQPSIRFAVVSLLIVIAVVTLLVPLFVKGNAQRGVITQALFRNNSILFAVPLMESLFGQNGVELASRILAIVIPMYNVIAILILEHYRGGSSSVGRLVKNIIQNPLMIGAAGGFAFALLPLTMPSFLEVPIAKIAGLASPLALFVLGGTLRFSSLRRNRIYIIPVLAVKLILIPAVIMLAALRFHFSPMETFAIFCTYGVPVATSTYPMAQEMGGDAGLAGELVLCSTAASIFTLFLWISIMKSTGLI